MDTFTFRFVAAPVLKHGASGTDIVALCGLKSAQRSSNATTTSDPSPPSEAPHFSAGVRHGGVPTGSRMDARPATTSATAANV